MITARLLTKQGEAWRADDVDGLPAQLPRDQLLWMDLLEPSARELSVLKERFALSDEAIDRIATNKAEPVLLEHESAVFVTLSVPAARQKSTELDPLYCFFGEGWVITVLPAHRESFEAVTQRLSKRGLSSLSDSPTSDLVFLLFFDAAISECYRVSESIDHRLEMIDEDFVTTARKVTSTDELLDVTSSIGTIKKEITTVIESLSSTRDIALTLSYGGVSFVAEENLDRFRKTCAESNRVLGAMGDVRERARKIVETQTELFNASSDRIMRLLTIIATIFLPLTLVAGIYGMNFTPGFFQPGTGEPLGFYVLVAAMLLFSVGLLSYFKKSNWI